MRWEALFADLDAQLDAAEADQLAGEVSDRSRREVARLQLTHRAELAAGAHLSVGVTGAGTVVGRLRRSGPGWWLLAGDAAESLVCTDAISWVAGLPALASEPASASGLLQR